MDPDSESRDIKGVMDQSADEIALVQHIRQQLEENRASANRIAHEGIWMTNIAYCISENTPIATESGPRMIQEVLSGERVWTREGLKEVVRVWDNGIKETICLGFSNGSYLNCTPDHRIYTRNRGWVAAGELTAIRSEDVFLSLLDGALKLVSMNISPNQERRVFDLTVKDCHEFFANGILVHNCLGYDGLMYNTTSRQFQPINRASAYLRKNRIHANKILPTVQNRLARLSQNPPEYDVAPETNDTEDKDAARLSLQVLDSLVDLCEVNKKRLFLYMWMQQCGHAYVRVYWDQTKGPWMIDPDSGQLARAGEVALDVESPFAVFPDPFARTDDDARSMIMAKVRPLDYFKHHYPTRGSLVREEAAWLLSAQYEQRVNSLNSRGPSQGGMTEQFKNSAIEMIKYEVPSMQYPNGRCIAAANGILLENKELPVGEIPLVKFDDTIVGGKYYSETPVTHARPIQDQYNETLRRRAEWTRRMLAGKYKAPRGSGLGQESLNDESGEIVLYNPVPTAGGANIEPLPVPTIPEYAYKEEDRLDNLINYIFGISDVSRGILPSASIPAIGAQLLQEQDQTRLSVITELNERAWSKAFRLMLKHVESFYVVDRKMKLAGKSREYIVTELNGKMLRGNTDVRVKRGSTQPNSKTLKRQDIVNTLSLGLLGDPKDPNVAAKILPLLEFGDSQDIWLDYAIDMSQIKRGMDKMERGELVMIAEEDNNGLWCQEINRFRKSDKFEQLPQEIQDLIMGNFRDRVNMLMPPGEHNTDMPPLPPMPPPPIGAGGEAVANLPKGVRATELAEQLRAAELAKMKGPVNSSNNPPPPGAPPGPPMGPQ